jgi:hypothetical protein
MTEFLVSIAILIALIERKNTSGIGPPYTMVGFNRHLITADGFIRIKNKPFSRSYVVDG